MPKTIIKIRTYMCPTGMMQHGSTPVCRYHVSEDQLQPNHKCPDCNLTLQLTTHPNDQRTITIIGEEELDNLELDDGNGMIEENGKSVIRMKTRKLTPQEKVEYRNKIRADIIKFKALEH